MKPSSSGNNSIAQVTARPLGLAVLGVLILGATLLAAPAAAQQPAYPDPSQPPQPAPQQPPANLPEVGRGFYAAPAPTYALPPEPEERVDRRGLVIEVAGGSGGVFDKGDGTFGIGYGLAVGGTLSPHFVAMFDMSSLTFAEAGGARASHAVFGGVLQAFIGSRFWVKAGGGMGQLALDNSFGFALAADERTIAGIAGIGVEVYQLQPDFAIDVQVRVAGGKYSRHGNIFNGAALVGFNWY
jgi:hypothetical protein